MSDCWVVEIDRARKLGFDEFVSADPCEFNHAELFQILQRLTLEYRMNEAYTCLVCINTVRPLCSHYSQGKNPQFSTSIKINTANHLEVDGALKVSP